jgi:hypothetical protein
MGFPSDDSSRGEAVGFEHLGADLDACVAQGLLPVRVRDAFNEAPLQTGKLLLHGRVALESRILPAPPVHVLAHGGLSDAEEGGYANLAPLRDESPGDLGADERQQSFDDKGLARLLGKPAWLPEGEKEVGFRDPAEDAGAGADSLRLPIGGAGSADGRGEPGAG